MADEAAEVDAAEAAPAAAWAAPAAFWAAAVEDSAAAVADSVAEVLFLLQADRPNMATAPRARTRLKVFFIWGLPKGWSSCVGSGAGAGMHLLVPEAADPGRDGRDEGAEQHADGDE